MDPTVEAQQNTRELRQARRMRTLSIISIFVSFSALVVAFSLQSAAYIQVLLGLVTVGCIEWEMICGRKLGALSGDQAASSDPKP